ncbi:MAG: ABC transporter permease [Dictyoglomaceae bacterium]|nr:ABC transporter permease [Dictyoglomaceae bacterium]
MNRKNLILNIRACLGRAQVRFIGLKRDLFWIPFDVLLPLLGVSTFIFIYKALKMPPITYSFVILGGSMIAYWLNILWSMASQLYWERMTGNLPLFFIAPCSINSILIGMAIGGIYATSIRALSIILLGIIFFNVPIHWQGLPQAILAFLLTLISLYGMGMMLSSIFLLSGREAWHLSNLLQEPIYLFSGFFFPIKTLGFWIASLASLIPASLGLDSLRQSLIPESKPFAFLSLEIELIILSILSLIYMSLSFILLKKIERIARREGRLITRWQ